MESDEKRRGSPPGGGGEGYSGGHLCHVCGYQYPNPHPSAKLRRSHRKNCGKPASPPAAAAATVADGGNGNCKRVQQEQVSDEHIGRKLFLGKGEGGDDEVNGASPANGGVGLLGSAQEIGDLVKNKNNADGFLEHSPTNGAGVQVANSECSQNPLTSCNGASHDTASLINLCTKKTAILDVHSQEDSSGIANSVNLVKNIEDAHDGAILVPVVSRNPAKTSSSIESELEILDKHSGVNFGTPSKDIPSEIAFNAEGTDLLMPCIDIEKTQTEAAGQFSENASLSTAEHSPEPAISYNELLDASSSFHQPDSEDGTMLNLEGCVEESKNLNVLPVSSNATVGEISMQTNGSCEGHILREPSMAEEHITTSVDKDPSTTKRNGFPKEEILHEEIESKEHSELILSVLKEQISIIEEPATPLMDPESCPKKSVGLDDIKSDDLFELATDNCHLEAPNLIESKQQIDSNTMPVDWSTVSNQMDLAEGKHSPISDECIPAVSSTRESGPALGAEVLSVESTDGTKDICSPDMSTGHSLQENGADRSDITVVPSEVVPAESQEKQNEEMTAKEINVVQSTDDIEEKKQNEDITAKEINVVQTADDIEEKKQQNEDITAKEINVVQSADDLEGKKQQNEDITAKEINVVQSADDLEGKKQNEARLNSDKNHVPLKVLLAEANIERKEKKTTSKDRVLSFRRRGSKDDVLSAKSGSPKSVSDHQDWNSPARLPNNNNEKRSKGRKQPWVPFICCPSIR